MKEKALIISAWFRPCSNSRAYMVNEYMKKKYKTKLVISDFSHHKKEKIKYDFEDVILIPTISYKSNISIRRIVSHINFAKSAAKLIEEENPSIVYICLPPNSVGFYCAKAAKKVGAFIILDILDVWPETIPIKNQILKEIFLRTMGVLWKKYRNMAKEKANFVIAESNIFSEILKLDKKKSQVVWLATPLNFEIGISDYTSKKNELIIGYIGTINKLVDFNSFVKIAKELRNRKIKIEIIGDGEYKDRFIEKLKEEEIEYKYYGIIYDENIKNGILSQWDFGYNGQKDSVVTGLTYKSIDYFSHGIPLLNSVKNDTWYLIEEYNCGINFTHKNLEEVIRKFNRISCADIKGMKKNTIDLYKNLFTWEIYEENMNRIFEHIGDLYARD